MALSNQKDIENQLAALVTAGDQTNNNLVHLRELQSQADAYKSLHDNFLVRYTQAVQDQSFPISEVQVVTRASVPLRKSWPKAIIVLAGGVFLGLAMGFGIALLREALDKGLHTASQVRNTLGLPCLGMLPAGWHGPSTFTCPLVGVSSPARMCISVDLPDPDGPITATSWPWSTSSETPRSACTAVGPSP